MSPLSERLEKLRPFHHDVELTPGVFTNPETRRIRHAVNLFFPGLLRLFGGSLEGLRVLDVGCNCGGFAFAARRFGAKEVVGIDPRPIHIEQANAIRDELNLSGMRFEVASIEELTAERFGEFDVVLLMGILYHLRDPIGAMHQVSRLTRSVVMIDSHVHFRSDSNEEDYPMWWMLRDTDFGLTDGLFEQEGGASGEAWLKFQAETPVEYSALPKQFEGSPQSRREQHFARLQSPEPPWAAVVPDSVMAKETGSLVMVPNRKALMDLVRDCGFEDLLEIVPHRFSEVRYLRRYRLGMFGF
ncbi:class I SAM-dependent methyltransferase, partial [Hyalangium sp.]|uniref:class I SAM-dependent methyltransferase n=1 Tax=Hyalangium sp. TaxID=2028555 RepID=UPI002D6FD966